MHLLPALVCGLLGLAAGPALAGLTLRVPADGPLWTLGWWSGRPAGERRIALVTGLAVIALALIGGALGWRAALPAYLWLGAAGVALAVIDADCHRLPNALTIPTYGAGLVLLGVAAAAERSPPAYLRALIAMAAVFALFFVLALAGALGFGDAKLAGVLGLYLGWLGWGRLLLGFAAGFVVGALIAVTLLAARVAGWKTDVAFGPSLLAGALLAAVAGRHLVDAYLSVGS